MYVIYKLNTVTGTWCLLKIMYSYLRKSEKEGLLEKNRGMRVLTVYKPE